MSILSYSMLLMITAYCYCESYQKVHLTAAAGLISSLKNYFRNECVFLLPTGHQRETRMSAKLGRLLSDQRIPATQAPLQNFNHTRANCRCGRTQALNVILSGDIPADSSLHQLSETTSLSGPTWLMFLVISSPQEVLAESYVPFDCEFLVARQGKNGEITLTEVYNIAKGKPLLSYHFGYWLSETQYDFPSTDFYSRRSSLQGLLISAATFENPPITVLHKIDGQIKFGGYFGEVWRVLEQKMQFRTIFSYPADGARGSVLKNGTTNGMIKMIVDNQVHVAVDAFGMSTTRANVVDFTVPLLSTRYCILVKPPDTLKMRWNNFLVPFSLRLWIALVGTLLVIAVHFALIYYLGRRFGNEEADNIKFYTFSDSLMLVLGIFCLQGHSTTPQSYSCRFVCISAYIIAVVIFGTYSATVISFLTVHETILPYSDLKSLMVTGGYTFGLSSTHAQNYISEYSRRFIEETFGESYQENVQTSVLEGMQRVCSSKYSYLVPMDTALAFKDKVNCTVVPLPRETSLYIPQGFAIVKKSPYLGLFNYNLNRLRANGVLYKHRVRSGMTKIFSKDKRKWTRVRMEEVAPVTGFLLAGIVISVAVLLLERTITARTLMQSQRNNFCCIAAVRYIDGGQPDHPHLPQRNILRQMEEKR